MDAVLAVNRSPVEMPVKVERIVKDQGTNDSGAEQQQAPGTSNNRHLIPTSSADNVKLFTSSSLPLHGLYEVMLIDKNKDGRVDAGDAIPEYVRVASQNSKSSSREDEAKNIDQFA